MNKENFKRANAIENEINDLNNYKSAAETGRQSEFFLRIEGKKTSGGPIYMNYSHKHSTCPDFLKESLQDDLNFIADRIIMKINKRIAELEKEFESL